MIVQSTTLDTMEKVIAIYGGTTWVKIEGRMLIGVNSSYTINSTGGSATNTLTTDNLPSHTHSFSHTHGTDSKGAHIHKLHNLAGLEVTKGSGYWVVFSQSGYDNQWETVSNGAHTHTTNSQSTTTTGATGSGTAINNMPPYKAVYIWERTA